VLKERVRNHFFNCRRRCAKRKLVLVRAQSVIRQDPITVTEAAPKLFLARRGGTDGSNTSLRRGRSLL
jgi:hypothetical protein